MKEQSPPASVWQEENNKEYIQIMTNSVMEATDQELFTSEALMQDRRVIHE